jgi:hypothetical protein
MTGARFAGIGRSWMVLGLAVAGLGVCTAAAAQEIVAQLDTVAVTPPRVEHMPRVEASATTLPRLDNFDNAPVSPRIDLTVFPPRRSAVGLAVGMSGMSQSATPTGAGLVATAPATVDLGLTWRHTMDNNQRIDITAWRRMATQPDAFTLVQQQTQPLYGARVEMNLNQGRKSGLVADRGFLGLQLEGGARISVKKKNGGQMVYYRTKF